MPQPADRPGAHHPAHPEEPQLQAGRPRPAAAEARCRRPARARGRRARADPQPVGRQTHPLPPRPRHDRTPDREPQHRRVRRHALAGGDQGPGAAHRARRGHGGRRRASADGASSTAATRACSSSSVPAPSTTRWPALDYARRLKRARRRGVPTRLLLVMRVYFEKPRTATGWKGFINDPLHGRLLPHRRGHGEGAPASCCDVAELGLPAGHRGARPDRAAVPTATSIAWTAIGARTSESQTHREMASRPVHAGRLQERHRRRPRGGHQRHPVSAARPHSFLGINSQGRSAIVRTRGNRYGHIVLRGGGGRPNYDTVSRLPGRAGAARRPSLPRNIVVDCSHANSLQGARACSRW
ncbi:MAG: hypothetical protein MZW92_50110 [Comamonadaceae bacterium]|nr:hypothetical protein [Comamonadaceae bacterium]